MSGRTGLGCGGATNPSSISIDGRTIYQLNMTLHGEEVPKPHFPLDKWSL